MASTSISTMVVAAPLMKNNSSNIATVSGRPSLPRRSSSLQHKAIIQKLRPLPFQFIWSVWHSKPDGAQEYQLSMLIDHVADIAAFYRIFNNMPWSQIRQRDSIHIFRSGVKPLWEDEENRNGGRWLIRIRPETGRAIKLWEEICLLCCGGELQAAITHEHDHILGISFSPKQYFTHISIWTKQGDNLRSIMMLEHTILAGLSPELRPRSQIEFSYRKHADKMLESVWVGVSKGIAVPSSFPLARLGLHRSLTTG